MADVDNAKMLLDLARQDLGAMLVLKSAKDVADRIFGFHAQQAVEKTLKAWLSVLGVTYPLTHSLDALFGLVEDEVGTADVVSFRSLDALDPFAVQLRYSTHDDSGNELDRNGLTGDVDKLLSHVDTIVSKA